MSQPLVQFSDAFVDAVAVDVGEMLHDAYLTIEQGFVDVMPDGTEVYWEDGELIIEMTHDRAAREFGLGAPIDPAVRSSVVAATAKVQRAAQEVLDGG